MTKNKPDTINPLAFIFFAVLIDAIGVRLIYPVAASIIMEVSAVNVNKAVVYSGWLIMSYAIMQFVFSPLIGALSDSFGRRPVLLLSLAGLSVSYFFLSIATTLTFLFIGRMIAGICSASITTGFAYAADISDTGKRARNFGIISAAIALGLILGPLIGGLLSRFGTRVPFVAAALLSIGNFLYGYFILPESLQPANRRPFDIKKSNPFVFFANLGKYKVIWKFLLVLFLFSLSAQALPSVWLFYTKYRYNWTDLEIGYSLAFVGLVTVIVKSFLVNKTRMVFGSLTTVYIGLLCSIGGLSLFAFASQPWMAYAFAFIYCLGGIATPCLQEILSEKVSLIEQGELQGIIVSLISLATVFSPLAMTRLFWIFTAPNSGINLPGISFLAAAGILSLSLLFLPKQPNRITKLLQKAFIYRHFK